MLTALNRQLQPQRYQRFAQANDALSVRRRDERHAIRVTALMHCHGRFQTVRIVNFSMGGLQLQGGSGVGVGYDITLELLSGERLSAKVAWSLGSKVGAQFLRPLTPEDPAYAVFLQSARPHSASSSMPITAEAQRGVIGIAPSKFGQRRVDPRLFGKGRFAQSFEEQPGWDRGRDEIALLWSAIENMAQGLCMFGPDNRLRICNARYARMYGLGEHDVSPGTGIREILHRRLNAGMISTDHAPGYVERVLAEIRDGKSATKFTELAGGRTIAVELRPLTHGGWAETHEDITERIEIKLRLDALAHQDALTSLPNRARLVEQLSCWTTGYQDDGVSLMYIHLHGFKQVNELVGPATGDALLVEAARRLLGCVRGDDFVARSGGNEFAIACVGHEVEEIGALAEKILRSMSGPYLLGENELFVAASIGVTQAVGNCPDALTLMSQAGLALQQAKRERGAYRFFEPVMHERAQARRELQLDLRKAMPRGELEVFYQPIVNTLSEKVASFEALLRWNHPVRGSVPPSDFIPVAEEADLIETMGEWVLRQACAQCADWPAHIKVAVNLSARQLKKAKFEAVVLSALAAAGISGERLELEITESAVLLADEDTMQLLHRLRSLGVCISMDDFGTGYSALSYLHRFPFDKVKIDRCFLRNNVDSNHSRHMLEAIAAMVGSLKIITTVEGVETLEQLTKVRALGCTEVQGYIYGKPMPAREVKNVMVHDMRIAGIGAVPSN